jgi:hypothetical protein
MSEPGQEEEPPALDLTGIPLDRIAWLCQASAAAVSPEDIHDRPALQRALRRAASAAGQAGEAFAGHGEQPPLLPLPPPAGQ